MVSELRLCCALWHSYLLPVSKHAACPFHCHLTVHMVACRWRERTRSDSGRGTRRLLRKCSWRNGSWFSDVWRVEHCNLKQTRQFKLIIVETRLSPRHEAYSLRSAVAVNIPSFACFVILFPDSKNYKAVIHFTSCSTICSILQRSCWVLLTMKRYRHSKGMLNCFTHLLVCCARNLFVVWGGGWFLWWDTFLSDNSPLCDHCLSKESAEMIVSFGVDSTSVAVSLHKMWPKVVQKKFVLVCLQLSKNQSGSISKPFRFLVDVKIRSTRICLISFACPTFASAKFWAAILHSVTWRAKDAKTKFATWEIHDLKSRSLNMFNGYFYFTFLSRWELSRKRKERLNRLANVRCLLVKQFLQISRKRVCDEVACLYFHTSAAI